MTSAADFLGKLGRLVQDELPWEAKQPKPIPIAPAHAWINTYLELLIAGVGLVATVVIFSYYCYGFYRQRQQQRHARVKLRYWTIDRINACLIPLGVAIGFIAHYFMTR